MKQRYTFQCWNCPRTYTLFREITKLQTLVVGCPYCNAEAVVDLAPFKKQIKQVARGGAQEQELGEALSLPDVLPTQKPEPQKPE